MLVISRETGIVRTEEDGLFVSRGIGLGCEGNTINRTQAVCSVGKNFGNTFTAWAVL